MVRAKQYRLGLLFVHGMGEQQRGDTITQMGDALTEWLRRWIRPPGNFTIREATLREGHETSVGTAGPSSHVSVVLTDGRQRGVATTSPVTRYPRASRSCRTGWRCASSTTPPSTGTSSPSVRPDHVIEVRRSILEEEDGPMLLHGLKAMHHQPISMPRELGLQPDPVRLAERYEAFIRAG